MTAEAFLNLMLFDAGELSEREALRLFQRLIDSGDVWHLPGFYGRTAVGLIEAGLCLYGPEPTTDYYGNRIPSRFELPPDQPGSLTWFLAQQEQAT